MVKETKQRVMISIPKTTVDDIETLCDQMGISKSAFISMAIGEKIMAYKKSFEISSEVLRGLGTELIKPIS